MPEEDKNQYVVLLCTRQYDPEKTKELVKGIWNEPFNPWLKPHAHIHETIPFKINLFTFSQPEKAASPILVTEFWIVIEVRPSQFLKADTPMLVTELGIVIELRPEQP